MNTRKHSQSPLTASLLSTTLYLDEALEDKRDYEIAAAAWKEFEASGDKGISFEELRKKLNV